MSGHAWINRIGLISVLGWSSAASGDTWHYTLDQVREEQQANFCDSKKSIEEIAGIFNTSGPRSGYAALSASPDCRVTVHSFTPRRILTTVTISKGKPGEYTLRFVEVENDRGDVLYMVTTRNVVAE